jgi:hypothetical protein
MSQNYHLDRQRDIPTSHRVCLRMAVVWTILGVLVMTGNVLAENPGLYMGDRQVVDFKDLVGLQRSGTAPKIGSPGEQILEIRRRVLGEAGAQTSRSRLAFLHSIVACRQVVFDDLDAAHLPAAELLNRLAEIRAKLARAQSALLADFEGLAGDFALRSYPEGKATRATEITRQFRAAGEQLLTLLDDLNAAGAAGDQQRFAEVLARLKAFFGDNFYQPEPPHLGAQPAATIMETRTPRVVGRDQLPAIEAADLALGVEEAAGYDPADLTENIDVRFTDEITALAAELDHSPIAIFEYVRNTIAWEPYRGSRKGAQQTLDHRRGNDYDQASLLLALLRVSGIPARYVQGYVELPIDQVTNWTGIDDANTAANLLHTAGFQVTGIGTPLEAIQCERVWVEAWLPYANYRGTISDSAGFMWVPLDPAFKQYTHEGGIDLVDEMAFDVQTLLDNYIAGLQDSTPVGYFRSLLADSLALDHPGATVADIVRKRAIRAEQFGYLPGTLPYMQLTRDASYSEIPAALRYRIRFHLYGGMGMDLDYTTSLPEIVQKQVTISYIGATPADQQIIDDAGGIFNVTDPWTVDLKPVLKIDGCVVATGGGYVMMGVTHTSDMHFYPPTGAGSQVPSISNVIIAGNYQGIGIDTEDAIPAEFEPPTAGCAEDYLGQVLHQTALTYLNNVDMAGDDAAELMHMMILNDVSEAIVENTVRVLFMGMTPITFEWTGMVVDADRKILGPYSYYGTGDPGDYMRLGGADGSYQENRVFETEFGEEAVSTIKILQLAGEQGIPVVDVTPGNIGTLTHPPSVINAVINALNQGHDVLIPRDPLIYYEWTGTGWIDMEPSTGAAGYLISGGHSGGATVQIWVISYPDMLCTLPIGPIEVEPAAVNDIYCWLSEDKWTFIVPELQYWGYDDDGECDMLHSERKEFPVDLTIKQIAEAFGTGTFTFRCGGPAIDCGCTELEKEVIIGKADLAVCRPPVLDPAETEIGEAVELSQGAQTFVNLDNDDQDDKFDLGTTDVAVAGEDEMCKITLRIEPKDIGGTAKIEAFGGTAAIKIWKSATKGTQYIPGTDMPLPGDFRVEGDQLVKDFWVEGIAPHTAHPGVKLKSSLSNLSDCGDWVAITVIGIDQIVWTGINNSVNDDNVLDADPNWPAGLDPGSDRVFPGARLVGSAVETEPRNRVNVEVTLTVAPVEPLNISFMSFDVDDPTADADPLDDETLFFDNRGTFPSYDGEFVTSSDNKATHAFNSQAGTVEFQVTGQPGDNFRIVGNGDQDFLDDLENDESALGAVNADKQRIINPLIAGTPAQKEIREADDYASKVLTVWRKLHVEFDSMGDVVNNYAEGFITSFNTGNSATATQVVVSNDLRDGSKDLDSAPSRNGRFEDGTLSVAGTHDIAPIDGNGKLRLVRAAGINVCATPLPFSAKDNDWWNNSTMSGMVTQITNSSTVLTLNITAHSETPIDWNDFLGGTVKIGTGPAMPITAVNPAGSTVTVAELRIPYRITDDDLANGNDVADPDLTVAPTAFAPAYALPVQDVGNHQGNLTFIANIPADDADSVMLGWQFDLSAHEANNDFWLVYLRGSLQHSTDVDDDADGEGGVLGIVTDIGPNGIGANIYLEIFRGGDAMVPVPASGLSEGHTVAHEIGHLFGGLHSDCTVGVAPCASAGLMAQSSVRNSPDFNEITLDKIRRIPHP